jgi:hypothetical protein
VKTALLIAKCEFIEIIFLSKQKLPVTPVVLKIIGTGAIKSSMLIYISKTDDDV